MNRQEARKLSVEELKICYNEYRRRWRKTHKDSIRLSNWKYHKKIRGSKEDQVGEV